MNFPPSGNNGSTAVVIGGVLFGVIGVVGVVTTVLFETQFLDFGPRFLDGESAERRPHLILGAVVATYSLVFLIMRGYDVAVLRAVVGSGEPTAPPFRFGVVRDGISATVILLCYFVPSLALGTIGLVLRRPTGQGLHGVLNTVGALSLLFGLFALIVAAYLIPAATALFATRRSIRAAFDRSALRACVATEDYAAGWMIANLFRLLLLPVTIALQALLIGFFLRFYLRVSVQHMYGQSISNAIKTDTASHRDATAS
ncbi:DUF4013 domain-containing protein [Halocatena pleomorpha]|uniref:DUF4013 domain-containing protein n=1 Tax=Halocatena pleomorpha TaxID=1785090 RepID=A0A3P3R2S1_9EURY|nr:DUF4013 domain-containing protein [Halocatena pleomorpha]